MGVFYAVGVGAGGGSSMTLEAAGILSSCASVFYPVVAGAHSAFDSVREAVDVGGKNCVALEFSMSRDVKKAEAEYALHARKVASALKEGDAAFVTVGDVSIYSTAAKMAGLVKELGFSVRFVAGVPSFCAAAASLALPLAAGDGEIRIVPGDAAFRSGRLGEILGSPGTKVFMKSPRHLREIIAEIRRRGLSESAYLVQDAGGAGERVFRGEEIERLGEGEYVGAYMSVVVVRGEKIV